MGISVESRQLTTDGIYVRYRNAIVNKYNDFEMKMEILNRKLTLEESSERVRALSLFINRIEPLFVKVIDSIYFSNVDVNTIKVLINDDTKEIKIEGRFPYKTKQENLDFLIQVMHSQLYKAKSEYYRWTDLPYEISEELAVPFV